ncbi:MAG: hypothetical protein V4696_13690 [Pseudomonadota bacterium]
MTIQEARTVAAAQANAARHYALAARILRGEADTHPLVIAALG